MATGNWSLFGINLPEFGLTEKIGGNKGSITYSSPAPVSYSSYQSIPSGSGAVLGTNNTITNSAPTPTYNAPTQPKPKSGGNGGSTGYSKREIFKSLGLDPNKSKDYYKQYGVDNALDFAKAYESAQLQKQADSSGLRDLINQRWDTYEDSLNAMATQAPTRQAEDLGYLGTQKQTMLGGLDQSRNYATQNLGSQRTAGIRELAQNFRSAGDAANMMVGAAGGGSSSAVPMASYALQKLANRGANELTRTQMAAQADLDNTYMTEKANLETWYNDNAKAVNDYYRSYIDRIEEMKLGANDTKAEALYNLEASIVEKAQQDLDALKQEAQARSQSLQDYAMRRMAELNNVKLATQNNANFDPYAIVQSEMGGAYPTFGASSGGNDYGYNLWRTKKKPSYLS